jgi:CRISPR system Cascade subunit CasB
MPQTSEEIDFIGLYNKYQSYLENNRGLAAEIRRVVEPEELKHIPAFYKLTSGIHRKSDGLTRFVYCLPYLTHLESGNSLGKSLAKSTKKVNEKRIFMVLRSTYPNDMIQLRRLLQFTEPKVDLFKVDKQIFYWNKLAKQQILEDFFFYQQNKGN